MNSILTRKVDGEHMVRLADYQALMQTYEAELEALRTLKTGAPLGVLTPATAYKLTDGSFLVITSNELQTNSVTAKHFPTMKEVQEFWEFIRPPLCPLHKPPGCGCA